MTVTASAGVTRLRAFQIGKETTFKTAVPATRRMPWAFSPSIDPAWTFSTADTGTLDQAIPPFRKALNATGQAVGELAFNDIPTLLGFGVMGGLSGPTWTAQPQSKAQDPFDTGTLQFFDDATGDAWAGEGAIITRFQLDYPQDQGPIVATSDWRIAKVTYPGSITGPLDVDAAPVLSFMGDTVFYVDDAFGSIESTALSNICYDAQVIYENNIDSKYWANGSDSRFEVQGFGRGERVITFALNGAKQTAWINECAKWIAENPVERFWGIKTIPTVAGYNFDIRIPGYWMTRAWQTVNSNTSFQLTGHQIYDQTAGYAAKFSALTTRAAL
jgi:hypothetical protein